MKEFKLNVSWKDGKFHGRLYNEFEFEYYEYEDENFHEMVYMLEGSINCGVDIYLEIDAEIPEWYYSKEYRFIYVFDNMQTLLKAYTTHISLAAISKITGINQALLSHYANGLKVPRKKQAELIVSAIKRIGEELSAASLP